jgi:hypothetical protein
VTYALLIHCLVLASRTTTTSETASTINCSLLIYASKRQSRYGAPNARNLSMDYFYSHVYGEGPMPTTIRGPSPNTRLHLFRRLPREYLSWSKARVRALIHPFFYSEPICRAIIDLVKTPARKKTAPKRTRAATSAAAKAQNSILLSLEVLYLFERLVYRDSCLFYRRRT